MKRLLLGSLLTMASAGLLGHGTVPRLDASPERAITFPDPQGVVLLVLDPHTHSVFSDGHVAPQIRVAEAQFDGLDALAVTEHLEWQPHRADIPHPDRNRAWEEATAAAVDLDLMVINGAEITREMPIGHINALFLSDANALLRADEAVDAADTIGYYTAAGSWAGEEALAAAAEQGAFVFWNHPFWPRQTPSGISRPSEFHERMFEEGLIHGIEVANGPFYSEAAFAVALEHDLTIIGTSDVHNLIDWDYAPHEGGHRPVTLVFAEERSEPALKAGLMDRATVAWYQNLLIGRPQHVGPILEASIEVVDATYLPDSEILSVVIANHSDATWQLDHVGEYGMGSVGAVLELEANTTTQVSVLTHGERLQAVELPFRVLNALVAPRTPARFNLSVQVD